MERRTFKRDVPISVGLLSFGMSGKLFHAPWFANLSGFKLRAVVERTRKAAKELYPDIISFDSVEELLADEPTDLVIVNLPSQLHFEFAMRAIKSGKSVLIEKPMCETVEEARRLFAAADEKGTFVFPYQNLRYSSDYRTLQKALRNGVVGRPIELTLSWDRYRSTKNVKAWKEDPKVRSAGLLYDIGPHLIDQALHLATDDLLDDNPLNEQADSSAVKLKAFHKITRSFRSRDLAAANDYFHISLCFSNDLVVHLTSTLLAADHSFSPAIVLRGQKGAFTKCRGDVQEPHLSSGMNPCSDPLYGRETADSTKGLLFTPSPDGQIAMTRTEAESGSTAPFFQQLHETLCNNASPAVTRDEIFMQLAILSAPDGYHDMDALMKNFELI